MRVYQFRQFPKCGKVRFCFLRSQRFTQKTSIVTLFLRHPPGSNNCRLWLIFTRNYIAKTSCGFLSLTTTMEGSSFCFERGILRHTSNHQPLLVYNEIPRPLHPWPMGLSFSLLLAGEEGLEPPTH